MEAISALIDGGQVKTLADKVLPLTEAQQTHRLGEGGQVRGKIVLQIV